MYHFPVLLQFHFLLKLCLFACSSREFQKNVLTPSSFPSRPKLSAAFEQDRCCFSSSFFFQIYIERGFIVCFRIISRHLAVCFWQAVGCVTEKKRKKALLLSVIYIVLFVKRRYLCYKICVACHVWLFKGKCFSSK